MKQKVFVIGIDGGGTQTTAAIADEKGNIIVEHKTTTSNPNIVGFKECGKIIDGLIKKCCNSVKIPPKNISFIVAGISGAGRSTEQKLIIKELQKYPYAKNLTIESDAHIALEGVLGGNFGIVVIAGTGSIAFGKDTEGKIHRVGGWGRIIGDEGSGFALGRQGLTAITHELDGRGKKTLLTKVVAKKFQLHNQENIIDAVYRKNFPIASIAPLVIRAAEKSDTICQKIIFTACSELIEHIHALRKKFPKNVKIPLVLHGGLLSRKNYYSESVIKMITKKFSDKIKIVKAHTSPVGGAIIMALERMKGT